MIVAFVGKNSSDADAALQALREENDQLKDANHRLMIKHSVLVTRLESVYEQKRVQDQNAASARDALESKIERLKVQVNQLYSASLNCKCDKLRKEVLQQESIIARQRAVIEDLDASLAAARDANANDDNLDGFVEDAIEDE